MHRRSLLRSAAIAASTIAMPGMLRAQAVPPDPALLIAIRDHLSFSVGFRRKFQTGFYQAPKTPSAATALASYGELTRQLGALANGETRLLIHWLAPDRTLHAWLIGASGVIAAGRSAGYDGLEFLREGLNINNRTATRGTSLGGGLRSAGPPGPALEAAAAQLLPAAVRSALSEASGRLLVLAASDTGGAPYAALPLGDGPLVNRWSVVVAPDLDSITDPARVFKVQGLRLDRALLVGDPDLSTDRANRWQPIPNTRSEVEAVAEMIAVPRERVLTGAAATREAVMSRIDGYGEADLIYLASHAVANSVNPMDGSFVALADGHLYGRDLRGSRFAAWAARHPLVVLSACQTGLGKTFEGGTYGIARAFVAAGAGQVVASLWNVDDAATAFLMTSFADKLTLGATPEEAMQMAQRRAAARYPEDPGAWASFVVFGPPAER